MKFRTTLLALGSAAAIAVPVLGAHTAAAVSPATQLVPDTTDSFRTGGCSGCFATQMAAVLSQFASIDRVFRGCAAGGGFAAGATDDACSGGVVAGKSRLQDQVVIQGTLKNSGSCSGLGQPGGGTATIRVSSNGSNFGISLAGSAGAGTAGFLAPEGFDGKPNTADDAGGSGTFGVVGGGAGGFGTAMTAPPLEVCNTKINANLPYTGGYGAAGPAGSCGNPTAPATERCVVNFDLSGDGQIDGQVGGAAAPGAITTVGAVAGNETTNLSVNGDMGFADLPTQDFSNPAFSAQSFNGGFTPGAQIFKIVVNKNVAAKAGVTTKLTLADPQIEDLFTTRGQTGSICSWDAAGGHVLAGANDNVTVCHREDGSGSRETFRNTFMLDGVGFKPQGVASTAVGTPDTGNCGAASGGGAQRLEGGGNKGTQKTYIENPTGGDLGNCVANNANAVGYVDVARTNANYYAVPVFGVDPDTAGTVANTDLRTLVKCGMYPYWGPLSGGDGQRSGAAANPFNVSHRSALASLLAFPAGNNYIPFGTNSTGISVTKSRTAGAYGFKFIPANCPGTPAPIGAKP